MITSSLINNNTHLWITINDYARNDVSSVVYYENDWFYKAGNADSVWFISDYVFVLKKKIDTITYAFQMNSFAKSLQKLNEKHLSYNVHRIIILPKKIRLAKTSRSSFFKLKKVNSDKFSYFRRHFMFTNFTSGPSNDS